MMEFVIMEPEFLSAAIGTAGLLAFSAVVLAGIFFGYVADEEVKGRRLMWLEEPIATVPTPVRLEKVELRKAA
jgi:hypothetical protein